MSTIIAASNMLLFFPATVQSASIYYGYSQSDQTTTVGNNTLYFTPTGSNFLISLNPTDELSLYAEYSALDDSQSVNQQATGDLELESLSLGAGYYLDNWSFSLSYLNWQDELLVSVDGTDITVVTDNTDADAYAFSISFDKTYDNWQWGISSGVHYSDWKSATESIVRTQDNETRNQSGVDTGDSLFISLSLSVAHYKALTTSSGLMFGGSLGWNQLTDSESEVVSRNGRNISQIANRTVRNLVTSQNIVGSESYGQMNIFISYDFAEHWVTDLNLSYDFSGEQNSSAWSINLGYRF